MRLVVKSRFEKGEYCLGITLPFPNTHWPVPGAINGLERGYFPGLYKVDAVAMIRTHLFHGA